MTFSSDRRSPTWQTIARILITAFGALALYLLQDTRSEVKRLDDEKVGRPEFEKVVKNLDQKTDLMIQLLRDHEQRNRR